MLSQRTAIPHPAAESADKPVGVTLEVEIVTDADTGRLELILSDRSHTYEQATPAEVRDAITAARAGLDQMEALANQYEAFTTGFQALVEQMGQERA